MLSSGILSERKSIINKKAKTEVESLQNEMEKVEEAILKYADKHQIETVQGSEMQVVINKNKDYVFPTKSSDLERYEELENLLKATKYWDSVSSINSSKIEQLLAENKIDEKLKKKIIALAPVEEVVKISIRKK